VIVFVDLPPGIGPPELRGKTLLRLPPTARIQGNGQPTGPPVLKRFSGCFALRRSKTS